MLGSPAPLVWQNGRRYGRDDQTVDHGRLLVAITMSLPPRYKQQLLVWQHILEQPTSAKIITSKHRWTFKILPSLVPHKIQTLCQQVIVRSAESRISCATDREHLLIMANRSSSERSIFSKWNNWTFMFDIIMLVRISLSSWPNINTLRASLPFFTADHSVGVRSPLSVFTFEQTNGAALVYVLLQRIWNNFNNANNMPKTKLLKKQSLNSIACHQHCCKVRLGRPNCSIGRRSTVHADGLVEESLQTTLSHSERAFPGQRPPIII